MLHFEVIFKSMTGPDDTGQVDIHAGMKWLNFLTAIWMEMQCGGQWIMTF